MNKCDLTKKVKKLLEKGNKRSEEQLEKYGFIFEKGFEAHLVDGKCADSYDGVKIESVSKNTLCRVKVGDPIVFDAYYEGTITISDYFVLYRYDNEMSDQKQNYEFSVFEQNGKYAIVSLEQDESSNYIDFNFEEFEVEEYIKLIE